MDESRNYPRIPYVAPRDYVTIESGTEALINPSLEEMLKENVLPKEIFVVCRDHKKAGYLMDESLRILEWPNMTKVFRSQRTIMTKYETIQFITQDKLDMICKGRHRTQVIWDFELEKGLDRYLEEQVKGKQYGRNDS